ncbi:PREDICTED: uncharacterized protein LOC106311149 isoform X2 [Brassica oleracea var. oleracea]|nr:PREDICTED: uncharacterized protein LOC106311149 isoform X2 [Brassica oleracea var. oleracea]
MTAATTFRGRLTSGKTTNLVMVVTTVDSKIFQENIYLDSNLGVAAIVATRDETMAGIQKRRTGVDCRSSHLPIVLSKSTDQVSITLYSVTAAVSKSPLMFPLTPSAKNHEANFLCIAKIACVLQQNEWSYVSCTGCNRKLEKPRTTLRYNKWVSPNVTGVIS